MATRPLPPPPPTIACVSCKGRFGLDYDEHGTPTTYHSLPYCQAFEDIETTVDAIAHLEACRSAVKTS